MPPARRGVDQRPAWEALCKAIRKPSGGYNPDAIIQILDYVRAVIDAPSKAPVQATAAAAE